MRAAVMTQWPGTLEILDVDVDAPGPREVLIRTSAAGLCHSDLHFMEGKYPYPTPAVMGHESAGVVEAVGDQVTYVQPGDRVITCLSAYCGNCEQCLTGHLSLCANDAQVSRPPEGPQRLSRDGDGVFQFLHVSSFAEQMLVHEHAVAKVTQDIALEQAALIGCGVLTGVGAVVNTAKVEPGTTVAVIGCGGVGLSAIQGARIAGSGKIIAIDTVESKLKLAEKLGATHVIDAGSTNAVGEVQEITGGGVHYSFEAIGLKETAEQAFQMLGRGGTATVIGMIPVGTNVEVHGFDLLMEKKLQGSNMGSNRFRVDMPRLIGFVLDGRLDLDSMLSARIGLDEVNEGFEALKAGEVARSVITFD